MFLYGLTIKGGKMIFRLFSVFLILGTFAFSSLYADRYAGILYLDVPSGQALVRLTQTANGPKWGYLDGPQPTNATSTPQAALDNFQEQTGFLNTPTGPQGRKSFPFLTVSQVQHGYHASANDLQGNVHTMYIVLINGPRKASIPEIVNNVNLLQRQATASVDPNNLPSSWAYVLYPLLLNKEFAPLDNTFTLLLSQNGVQNYMNKVPIPLTTPISNPAISPPTMSAPPSLPPGFVQRMLSARMGFRKASSSPIGNLDFLRRKGFALSPRAQVSTPLFPTLRRGLGFSSVIGRRGSNMYSLGSRFGNFPFLLRRGRLGFFSSYSQFTSLFGQRLFHRHFLSPQP